MNTPIYDQLSTERDIRVPERPTPWPRHQEETAMTDPEQTDEAPDEAEGPNEPCCGPGQDDDATDEET